MNHIATIATVALSLAAAASAFAESPTVDTQAKAVSTLSRADVRAQVMQARTAGTLIVNEADLYKVEPANSTRSRAEVRSETLAAIASGEVQALSGESNAFGHPFNAGMQPSVQTRLTVVSR